MFLKWVKNLIQSTVNITFGKSNYSASINFRALYAAHILVTSKKVNYCWVSHMPPKNTAPAQPSVIKSTIFNATIISEISNAFK